VDDAAEGILAGAEKYGGADPVNIGAGFEISTNDPVHLIARLTKFEGKIFWYATKPNGQPLRKLDTSRALAEFGFQARN